MLTKRNILTGSLAIPALAILAACQTGTGTAVPVLTQVQSWVNVINSELPVFMKEAEAAGILTGANDTKAQAALVAFQKLAAQVLAPTFDVSNVTAILTQVGAALTVILTAIPATAPFVPLVQTALLVLNAFLAVTPIVVPPTPTSSQLASMHTATIKFKK